MKNMRKIVSIFLSMAMLFTVTSAFASNDPVSVTYNATKYVAVAGNAGSENVGVEAALMLVKKGADKANLTSEDIGYIGQTEIDTDGKYLFEFSFDGFTYDNGVVDNYEIFVNINGEEKTQTVTQARVTSEMLSFNLKFDTYGEATANITNSLGLKDVSYTLVVAFYNGEDKLVGVKRANKFTGDDGVLTYTESEVPQGATYAKAFLWESEIQLIPLTASESYNFE